MVGVPGVRGNVEGKRALAVRPRELGIALVGNVELLATMPSVRLRRALVEGHVVVRVVPRRVSVAARGATMRSAKRK